MSEEQITPLNKVTDLSQVRTKGIVQLEKNTFIIKQSNKYLILSIINFLKYYILI